MKNKRRIKCKTKEPKSHETMHACMKKTPGDHHFSSLLNSIFSNQELIENPLPSLLFLSLKAMNNLVACALHPSNPFLERFLYFPFQSI